MALVPYRKRVYAEATPSYPVEVYRPYKVARRLTRGIYAPRRAVVAMRYPSYRRWRQSPRAPVRMAQVERKFLDTLISAQATSNAWQVTNSQNLIAQGTTQSTRVGRKVTIRNIHCSGQVELTDTVDVEASPGPVKVKICLMQDTQANGANPTASGTAGVYSDTDINSFHNLANAGRFRTLYVWEDVLNVSGGAGAGTSGNDWAGETKPLAYHKDVNIPIEFNSTTGAITEILSNNLFWAFCASNSAGCTFTVRTRIRFTDL